MPAEQMATEQAAPPTLSVPPLVQLLSEHYYAETDSETDGGTDGGTDSEEEHDEAAMRHSADDGLIRDRVMCAPVLPDPPSPALRPAPTACPATPPPPTPPLPQPAFLLAVDQNTGDEAESGAVSGARCGAESGAESGMTLGKRKLTVHDELLKHAQLAAKRLRRSEARGARNFNSAGEEVPYVRTEVRRVLNSLDRHILESCGQHMRVTQLKGVVDAAAEVKKVLQPANRWRATSLDDALMNEAWLVLDPAYAADSYLMGITGFGEAMGPRASDFFAALRMHFVPAITGNDVDWERFAGKNNPAAEKRRRRLAHANGCLCGFAGCSELWMESTSCEIDEFGGLLPETRCGCCCLRRLFALMGPGSPTRAAFLRLSAKAKFSWEKKAVPMKKLQDGSYDGAEWFRTDEPSKSVTVEMLNTMFRKWGTRINEKRDDLSLEPLNLDLFRSHSIRHGAARNLKRMGIDLDTAAAHLCMSREVLERVYGMEDATVSGARVTGHVVGSSTRER